MTYRLLITGTSHWQDAPDPNFTAGRSAVWLLWVYRRIGDWELVVDADFAAELERIAADPVDGLHHDFAPAIAWALGAATPFAPDRHGPSSLHLHLHLDERTGPAVHFDTLALFRLPQDNYISALNRFLFPFLRSAFTGELRRLQDLSVNKDGKTAAVFLSGPSMDDVTFTEADVTRIDRPIFANSTIANVDLMRRFGDRPLFVTASDPIFHCGYSSYVADFYRDLNARFEEFDFTLIVPRRDVFFYLAMVPEAYADRVRYLEYGPLAPFEAPLETVPFGGAWTLSDNRNMMTSNVLTGFALPLAEHVAAKVELYGCDGRKDADNAYYWNHANQFQYSDKMAAIRRLHPDFFPNEYDSYYRKHLQQTRFVCHAMRENLAIEVKTPTYIPTLNAYHDLAEPDPALDLSIIIPAYECGTKIWRSINSLGFDRIGVEVLLVDDGSGPESAAILDDVAARFDGIRLLRQDNAGVSAARNAGLAAARGRYVLFLDAGDELIAHQVTAMVERAREHDYLAIAGRVDLVHNEVQLGSSSRARGAFWTVDDLAQGYPVNTIATILDRHVAAERRFDPGKRNSEDLQYFWNILRRGVAIATHDAVTARYHIEQDGATTRLPVHHAMSVMRFFADQPDSDSPTFLRSWTDKERDALRDVTRVAFRTLLYYLAVMDEPVDEAFLGQLRALDLPPGAVPGFSRQQARLWAARSGFRPVTQVGLANVGKAGEAADLDVIAVQEALARLAAPAATFPRQSLTMLTGPLTHLTLDTTAAFPARIKKALSPPILFLSDTLCVSYRPNHKYLLVETVLDGRPRRRTVEVTRNRPVGLELRFGEDRTEAVVNDTAVTADPVDWRQVRIGGGYLQRLWNTDIRANGVAPEPEGGLHAAFRPAGSAAESVATYPIGTAPEGPSRLDRLRRVAGRVKRRLLN